MKTLLVFCKANCKTLDRTDLESFEGYIFADLEDFKRFITNKFNVNAYSDLTLLSLYEFTTDWNDSDDEDCYLSYYKNTFMTFIHLTN